MGKKIAIWDEKQREVFSLIKIDYWLTSWEKVALFEDFNEVENIFIKANLSWKPDLAYTVYEGIDILVYLRHQKVLKPIFICSVTPREYLLSSNGLVHFGFLKLIHSHPFILLPSIIEEEQLKIGIPVTELQLQDAINHFGNAAGVIKEQFHYLKNHFSDAKKAIPNGFRMIRGVLPDRHAEVLLKMETELLYRRNLQSITTYLGALKDKREKVFELLPVVARIKRKKAKLATWRVLYIDDQKEHGQQLRHELNIRGINCRLAYSGDEAIKILNQDFSDVQANGRTSSWPKNSITVVVCDLRFKDENGNWHAMQGYDIIEYIYKRLNNFVSFVILSAKSTELEELQDKLGYIRWRAFNKENILATENNKGFSLLADHIQQEGEDVAYLLTSFPDAKVWTTSWKGKINISYQKLYRAFRLKVDYLPKENWIANCANEFIDAAVLVKDPLFRKIVKIDASLSFSLKFKAGIPDEMPSDANLERFYVKLIGRRIAIGLFAKGWNIRDISNILKYQELNEESIDRQLFSAYLALSTDLDKIIPNRLLVEERNWMETYIGYSMHPDDRRFFSALKQLLEDFQEKLYKADCPDDFVEADLLIGDKNAALEVFNLSKKLCAQNGLGTEFESDFNRFFNNPLFHNAAYRNGLLALLS